MKIAIVTDSTAYLPERIKDHPNLFVIPIPVILDGKIYNEGIDIEADEYYALLNNSKEFPTTSQPALGEVLELYKSIAEQGYDTIISIHLSSGISGFVHTLHGLTDEIPGVALYPYDSKITSMPMGHMVEAALDLTEEKASLEEIFAKLDLIRDNTYAYLIVEDQHGGGIFRFQQTLGHALTQAGHWHAFFAARAQSGLRCRFNSGCFRLAFRQMFFHIFTGQTPTHTSAFNGAGFQIVFSQQATDRRAERIVVLFFQRRLLALCRRRRFLFRFRAGLFTRAVAFTQATQDLARGDSRPLLFQNRIQNAVR